jgi:hypothetical protein
MAGLSLAAANGPDVESLPPLFAPEPHCESTRPDDCEYAGPHRDLGAAHNELRLENESQNMEHCNERKEHCC